MGIMHMIKKKLVNLTENCVTFGDTQIEEVYHISPHETKNKEIIFFLNRELNISMHLTSKNMHFKFFKINRNYTIRLFY